MSTLNPKKQYRLKKNCLYYLTSEQVPKDCEPGWQFYFPDMFDYGEADFHWSQIPEWIQQAFLSHPDLKTTVAMTPTKKVSQPDTFEQIKQYFESNNLEQMAKYLIRTPEIQTIYEKHLVEIKSTSLTPAEYIIKSLELKKNSRLVTDNKYPYNWTFPCKHDILWVYSNRITLQEAKTFIINHYPNKEFFIFENSLEKRSVKDLQHYHVIFKL